MNNNPIDLLKIEIKEILKNYLNNNKLDSLDSKKLFQFIYNDFVYGSVDYEITNLLKSYFILNNLNNNILFDNNNDDNDNKNNDNKNNDNNDNNDNIEFKKNTEHNDESKECCNLKLENLNDLLYKEYKEDEVKKQIITKRRYLH